MEAIHEVTTTTDNATNKINVHCNAYKFPFFVCSTIKQSVRSSTKQNVLEGQLEDALSVVDDTAKKYKLYMAHVARCTNQYMS